PRGARVDLRDLAARPAGLPERDERPRRRVARARGRRAVAAARGGSLTRSGEDVAQMKPEVRLDVALPANRVVVEDHAVAAHVERELLSALGEQDRLLPGGM